MSIDISLSFRSVTWLSVRAENRSLCPNGSASFVQWRLKLPLDNGIKGGSCFSRKSGRVGDKVA